MASIKRRKRGSQQCKRQQEHGALGWLPLRCRFAAEHCGRRQSSRRRFCQPCCSKSCSDGPSGCNAAWQGLCFLRECLVCSLDAACWHVHSGRGGRHPLALEAAAMRKFPRLKHSTLLSNKLKCRRLSWSHQRVPSGPRPPQQALTPRTQAHTVQCCSINREQDAGAPAGTVPYCRRCRRRCGASEAGRVSLRPSEPTPLF